jgi:S1-C subfamily serine protease
VAAFGNDKVGRAPGPVASAGDRRRSTGALRVVVVLAAPFLLSLVLVAPGDPGGLLDPAAWSWAVGGRALATPPQQPPAVLGVLTGAASTRISGVLPASPAARAGLQRGDVLCGLDDHVVTDPAQIRHLLSSRRPGDDVLVDVERNGTRMRVRVVLAAPGHGP